MNLESLISAAREQGASDLHLEAGLPPAMRIRGTLRTSQEPVSPSLLHQWAQAIIGPAEWPQFLERRSYDLSRTIGRVRCRINILQSSRGVGMAIRLLASFQATLESLNLLPDLKRLVTPTNGLVLVCGPTGCGKSSTLAALIQEINSTEARHVLTIESPIEYTFRPRLAYIRQREVGRDTPSFEQALLDALREDPDVLMVGELRDPETMRLTLNASETGHLVLATVHSASCIEALQRIIAAFPAEMQNSVRAQLADCINAVVSQRLRYRPDLKIRVPECEILMATHAVRSFIRSGDLYKITTALETGAESGMWSFARYGQWLENRKQWHTSGAAEELEPDAGGASPVPDVLPPLPVRTALRPGKSPEIAVAKPVATGGAIEIEPVEGGLNELIRKLGGP